MAGQKDSQDTEDSSEEELDAPRPNRWTGAPSTWLTITEQERAVVTSLDELRNRDLSIHLYNAHALKKRGRELKDRLADGIKVFIILAAYIPSFTN